VLPTENNQHFAGFKLNLVENAISNTSTLPNSSQNSQNYAKSILQTPLNLEKLLTPKNKVRIYCILVLDF